MLRVLALTLCAAGALAYTGGDDRFVKKYAMMKVYESCFGPEVVREVRQEMRVASAKCAAGQSSPAEPPPPPPPPPHRVHSRPHSQQQQQQQQQQPHGQQSQGSPGLDSTRLQQALLAVLNRQAPSGYTMPHYRPQPAPVQPAPAPAPSYAAPTGYSPASPGLAELLSQYQPGPAPGVFQAMPQVDPLQALQALQAIQQAQQVQQVQQMQQYSPQPKNGYYQAYYQQPFSGRGRHSRDLDIQGQLETLTSRMSGRVKNVTCVMQELGYLDGNMEPDFDRITERIARLPVAVELRRDMMEGVQFCKQFSQCVPESRRDKFMLSGELLRPMFFFRCYKHKKMEACIMKDVRERYAQAAQAAHGQDGLDENLLPGAAEMRSMLRDKDSPLTEDNMAAAVYEFLYGEDNLDTDSLV